MNNDLESVGPHTGAIREWLNTPYVGDLKTTRGDRILQACADAQMALGVATSGLTPPVTDGDVAKLPEALRLAAKIIEVIHRELSPILAEEDRLS